MSSAHFLPWPPSPRSCGIAVIHTSSSSPLSRRTHLVSSQNARIRWDSFYREAFGLRAMYDFTEEEKEHHQWVSSSLLRLPVLATE